MRKNYTDRELLLYDCIGWAMRPISVNSDAFQPSNGFLFLDELFDKKEISGEGWNIELLDLKTDITKSYPYLEINNLVKETRRFVQLGETQIICADLEWGTVQIGLFSMNEFWTLSNDNFIEYLFLYPEQRQAYEILCNKYPSLLLLSCPHCGQ